MGIIAQHDSVKPARIFLAYPSDELIADWMRLLKSDLVSLGHAVQSWEDFRDPGLLFAPIARAIDDSDLVLAETTGANPNVMFELGYSIARDKATYQLINANQAATKFRPLEVVRHIPYSVRKNVTDFFESEIDLANTIHRQLGLETALGASSNNGLYFVPPQVSRVPGRGVSNWSTG